MSKRGKDSAKEVKKAKVIRVDGMENYTVFPFFLVTGEGDIDLSDLEAPISYVLTGTGLKMYQSSGVFTSLTDAGGVANLTEIPDKCIYALSKMPSALVKQINSFFQWAYDEGQAEAIVMPYYNADTEEWFILCPQQTVGAGHAKYEFDPFSEEIPEGFVRVGSWHSHGSSEAFHSSVDDRDEDSDDGIHLTSGKFCHQSPVIMPSKVEVVASIMANGVRWNLSPEKLLHSKISTKDTGEITSWAGGTKYVTPAHKEYYLKLPMINDKSFPQEWKKQVSFIKPVTVVTHHQGGYSPDYTPYNPPKLKPSCSSCLYSLSTYQIPDYMAALEVVQSLPKSEFDTLVTVMHWGMLSDVPKAMDILKKRFLVTPEMKLPNGSWKSLSLQVIHRAVTAVYLEEEGDIEASMNYADACLNGRVCLNTESRARKDKLESGEASEATLAVEIKYGVEVMETCKNCFQYAASPDDYFRADTMTGKDLLKFIEKAEELEKADIDLKCPNRNTTQGAKKDTTADGTPYVAPRTCIECECFHNVLLPTNASDEPCEKYLKLAGEMDVDALVEAATKDDTATRCSFFTKTVEEFFAGEAPKDEEPKPVAGDDFSDIETID
jgi:hypothetical protein